MNKNNIRCNLFVFVNAIHTMPTYIFSIHIIIIVILYIIIISYAYISIIINILGIKVEKNKTKQQTPTPYFKYRIESLNPLPPYVHFPHSKSHAISYYSKFKLVAWCQCCMCVMYSCIWLETCLIG